MGKSSVSMVHVPWKKRSKPQNPNGQQCFQAGRVDNGSLDQLDEDFDEARATSPGWGMKLGTSLDSIGVAKCPMNYAILMDFGDIT